TGGVATLDSVTSADSAPGIALAPDGKIVLGGNTGGNVTPDLAVARLDDHGAPDPSFSGDGIETIPLDGIQLGHDVAVQDDGRIVLVGTTGGGGDFILARLLAGGGLDNSFASGGIQTTGFDSGLDSANAVAIQDDGKIIAAGLATTLAHETDFALARFL